MRFNLSYHFAENLSTSIAIKQKIINNITNKSIGPSSEDYPQVQTTSLLYSNNTPVLEQTTLDYTFRPIENIYSQVSADLLKHIYCRASLKILWSHAASPFSFRLEVNSLQQKKPDTLIDTNDLQIDSWHTSGYFSFGNGFHAQLDLGRYLANNTNSTFTLEREFANNIRIRAYATLTNMSFDNFSKGSFDKRISVTIPIATLIGTPTTTHNTTAISSLTHDGNARVNITNHLYPSIRKARQASFHHSWEGVLQ